MTVVDCHDCGKKVVFLHGLPGGAVIGVCHGCGEKRRRIEAARPDFAGFSREPFQLSIDGQPAAISTTTVWD
jgi:hypothetical protein